MIPLSLPEAQLFRLLTGFFGPDRVVPRMRVVALCGGEVPQTLLQNFPDLSSWATEHTCLFTVVDDDDAPKMVVEFFSGIGDVIDVEQVEHQRVLKPLLEAIGIHYVTISDGEFEEMLDPKGSLDLVAFLSDKFRVLECEPQS